MKKNIILMPHIQDTLQASSIQHMKNKEYEAALEIYDELTSYGIQSYENNINKLICLIELKELDQALVYCEQLSQESDEHYVDYFDYYIMILYEQGQYIEVIEEINLAKENYDFTGEMEEKLSVVMKLANQMNEEELQTVRNKFNRAVMNQDHIWQWNYLQQLKKLSPEIINGIEELLVEKSIHPVIKTFIFYWCQGSGMTEEIELEKFNQSLTVIPHDFPLIKEHSLYNELQREMEDMEQHNPTLYEMMLALLDSYFYVNYPLIFDTDVDNFIIVLKYVAETHLNIEDASNDVTNLETMVEMIQLSHHLFKSIIPE